MVLYDDAKAAVADSQTIVTDVWVSMGDDEGTRAQDFQNFQVNEELMAAAAGDAIFMHCLPAWRGMEVTAGVIDGPQSVVFDEAENACMPRRLFWHGVLEVTDGCNDAGNGVDAVSGA